MFRPYAHDDVCGYPLDVERCDYDYVVSFRFVISHGCGMGIGMEMGRHWWMVLLYEKEMKKITR